LQKKFWQTFASLQKFWQTVGAFMLFYFTRESGIKNPIEINKKSSVEWS